MATRLTFDDFDKITTMSRITANRADIAKITGRSIRTVNSFLRSVEYAKKEDWDRLLYEIEQGHIGRTLVLNWLRERLGITVPSETLHKAKTVPVHNGKVNPDTESQKVKPQPVDMTAEYLTRVLTALATQNEMLKSLLEAVKSYGPAILSAMQTTGKRPNSTVLEGAIHDATKELAADVKDNINANTEILRQELTAIKNNSRKRGL